MAFASSGGVPSLRCPKGNTVNSRRFQPTEDSVSEGFRTGREGYAAFTCSKRDIDDLIEYIKGREEHH